MLSYLPDAVSTFAHDIDGVITLITWLCGAWLVAAEALLLFFVLGTRRRPGVRAPWVPGDTPAAMAFVLVPAAAIFACDVVIEVVADRVWHDVKIHAPETQFEVGITGRQYAWLFTYPGPDRALWTEDDVVATEMHVPVDQVARFHLRSADVLHAFFVPELRLKQDAVPGRDIRGWFEASKTGTYEIACAEICGRNHTDMRALLVVEDRKAFDAWLGTQTDATGGL